MRKKYPQLTANLPSNPLPASFEVTPHDAEDVKVIAADLRAQKFAGVEKVKDGQQTSKRILQVGKWIWFVFVVMVIVLLHRLRDPDREHDPALDLLPPPRDRGDEARRGDELVRARPVHARGAAVRARRLDRGGAAAAAREEVALPAILGHIDTTDDVKALSFVATALVLLAVGLGVGALGSGMTLRRFLKV